MFLAGNEAAIGKVAPKTPEMTSKNPAMTPKTPKMTPKMLPEKKSFHEGNRDMLKDNNLSLNRFHIFHTTYS
jgi:hypothetical protein